MGIFGGRRLCIATKHGKEAVIAPQLETLGISCIVPADFDTDVLGTFSGEIERLQSPLETARKKCLLAMEKTGCDLAVSSEGSFGNHPTLFFVPADEEFLLFIDKKNDIEIVARHLTTETNFNTKEITNEEDLWDFAEKVKFPEHAIILKSEEKDWSYLKKGIQSQEELKNAYYECREAYKTAFVETDMRAMLNPLRMEAIRQATAILVRKMQSLCPNCKMPGFDIVEMQSGLPCNQCGMPTKSIVNAVYRCGHCDHERIEKYPKGKEFEDPMYCDVCNP